MIQIEYFVDTRGKMPFWEWQKSLKDLNGKVAVLTRLNRIRIGNLGDWKTVAKGVFELRILYRPGYRVYFSRENERKIIVLCAGDKCSQKQDIKKAQKYWAIWRGEK